MAGVAGEDWWVQVGEPGNLELPGEWSGSGPHGEDGHMLSVSCYNKPYT